MIHLHAELTPFAKKKTELVHAHAYLNIMVTLMEDVNRNAFEIQIVIDQLLASTKNAKTLVLEFAETMPNVMSSTILQYVNVQQVILEIHFLVVVNPQEVHN